MTPAAGRSGRSGNLGADMERLGSSHRAARTLVVGSGFIGSSVAGALLDAGHDVSVLTRSRPSPVVAARLAGARVVVGDAADALTVATALDGVADVVYCAGAAGPAEAERDPAAAERLSLPPLAAVVDGLCRRPGARLLFVSSGGTVYGDAGPVPVPEDRPLRPAGVYARLKVAGERHLAAARARDGLDATALRCANVYGLHQAAWRSQGVVATLMAAAADGAMAPLYGDGLAVRDHVAVDDVADAVVALLARPDPLPPAVNVGTGVGTALADLVAAVEAVTGRPLAVRYEPARPTDLGQVVLDVSLLRSLVPYAPTPLADGLAALWAGRPAVAGEPAPDRSVA
jgi:UDP-glucose 4-epimerase